MGIVMEGTGLARDAERHRVTIGLSELAFEALSGDRAAEAGERMVSALRFYLGDSGRERSAWPYPAFLRGSEGKGDVQIELELPVEHWRDFEAEAARQGVAAGQLA